MLAVTEDTFEDEVLKEAGKVIVDFWAPWCGPCHALMPVLEKIGEVHGVKVVKVNTEEEDDLVELYDVRTVPTVMLFELGEKSAEAIGAMPKGRMERALGLVEVTE